MSLIPFAPFFTADFLASFFTLLPRSRTLLAREEFSEFGVTLAHERAAVGDSNEHAMNLASQQPVGSRSEAIR
jgi:hypothetical protein